MLMGERYVSFNGVLVPGNSAVHLCRNSVVALHTRTGDLSWPIANRGTGFLYRYRGRQFCLFTRHQIKPDYHHQQIVIQLILDSDRLYAGGRFFEYATSTDEREECDVCALEVPWELDRSASEVCFFNATSCRNSGQKKYFTVGFPHKLAELAGEERSEGIRIAQVLVWGEAVERDQSGLFVLHLGGESSIMIPRCGGDFSGFSGAPVFSFDRDFKSVAFEGIVNRGGCDKLFFVPAVWADAVCDIAFKNAAIPHMHVTAIQPKNSR